MGTEHTLSILLGWKFDMRIATNMIQTSISQSQLSLNVQGQLASSAAQFRFDPLQPESRPIGHSIRWIDSIAGKR